METLKLKAHVGEDGLLKIESSLFDMHLYSVVRTPYMASHVHQVKAICR